MHSCVALMCCTHLSISVLTHMSHVPYNNPIHNPTGAPVCRKPPSLTVYRRYGLGTIYFRQEKYDLSEYHFKRALSINPTSSALCCYLGMVLNANRRHEEVRRGGQWRETYPILL